MKKFSLAFEIAIALIVILLIVGVGLPQYNKMKDKAKESEAKQNLHIIQLAISYYGIDHWDDIGYPQYLIGGCGSQETTNDASRYIKSVHYPNSSKLLIVSDPLLCEGYLASYPRNPFFGKRSAMKVANLQETVGDPMRKGAIGDTLGLRFGTDCTLMGNVSCDYRFPAFKAENREGNMVDYPTNADFDGYRFYDAYLMKEPDMYLPGEFLYKATGAIVLENPQTFSIDKPIAPRRIEGCMLCLFGNIKTSLDILGPEPSVLTYQYIANRKLASESEGVTEGDAIIVPSDVSVPSWTRWYNKPRKDGTYPGSPFGVWSPSRLLSSTNPDGIRDGIILYLQPGPVVDRYDPEMKGKKFE
jgi:hypothetical protein